MRPFIRRLLRGGDDVTGATPGVRRLKPRSIRVADLGIVRDENTESMLLGYVIELDIVLELHELSLVSSWKRRAASPNQM